MSFYKEYLKKKEEGGEIKLPSPENPISETVKKINIPKPPQEEIKIFPKENLVSSEKKPESVKERLAQIQEAEEKERQRFLQRLQGNDQVEAPEIKIPTDISSLPLSVPTPPKPAKSNKIWTRIIIVLGLILAISLVGLLIFVLITRERTMPTPQNEEPRDVPQNEIPTPIKITPPRSLLNYDGFREPVITRPNEFQTHLNQLIQENITVNNLIKVTFKDQINPQEPRFHGIRDFFGEFRITIPGLFERIEEESFNLFVYSQEEGRRIGMILRITEPSGFLGTIREWEPNARTNFIKLFEFLQKDITPEIPAFLSSTHRGETIWCQEYQEDDFGICYSVTRNNFFILSTSLQSVRAAIDKF